MFENKYNDAAKLFKKIIVVQPTNKAAHIRLQECVEKQPELSDTEEISETSEKSISDLDLENFIQSKKIDNDNLNENIDMKENTYLKKSNENSEDKELETDPISNFIEEIHKLPKYGVRHKYNDDELQKMYEEAIYTMFQNNYDEAAELFQQILRIRPENKAARIRLQECREASGNA
jgi:thioredoxin-like negative regulator of GroEL